MSYVTEMKWRHNVRRIAMRTGAFLATATLLVLISVVVDRGVVENVAFASAASDACRLCHGTGTPPTVSGLHHTLTAPPAGGCMACHSYGISECSNCHGPAAKWPVAPHDGSNALTAHNKAAIDAAVCQQCHQPNVVPEHANRNLNCAACHSSTTAAVQQTIAAGRAGTVVYCSNCHGPTDHTAAHDKALTDAAACQQCHNSNVVPEHAAHNYGCTACHSSTNQAVLQAINTGKGATGTAVYCSTCHGPTDHTAAHDNALLDVPGCQQCHQANVVPEHAARNLDCAACHSSTSSTVQQAITLGKSGTVVYCSSCHGPSNHEVQHDKTFVDENFCQECHKNNVVTEHATWNVGCVVCHSSTNTKVKQTISKGLGSGGSPVYCADCHGVVDHASVHDKALTDNATCAQCHNSNVVPEHSARSLKCGVCHESTNTAVIKAISTGRSGTAVYCSTCHGPTDHAAAHDKALLDAPGCQQCHQGNVVPEHAARNLSCAACHSSTSSIVQQAIILGKSGTEVYCLSCHGPSNHEVQHDKTFVDENFCQECHKSNVVKEHATWNVGCSVCHSSADAKVKQAISKGQGTSGSPVYCADCHGVIDHASVHNKALIDNATCTQCHNSNVVPEHSARGLKCGVCHQSTNAGVIQAISAGRSGTSVFCSTCHGATDHASAHDKALIDNATCQECHKSNVVTEHAANNFGCAACHSSTDSKVIQAINTGKGPSGTAVYCSTCHGTTDHISAHDQTLMDNDTCQKCHNPNVVTEHAAHGLNCNVCHSSTNAAVQQAIKTGMTGTAVYCNTCHGPTDHTAAHKDITAGDCSKCHDGNVVTGHSTCAACHGSTKQAVIDTIKQGIAGTPVSCSTCHAAFSAHWTQHNKANLTTLPDCLQCHSSNVVVEHDKKGVYCNTCHLSSSPKAILAIDKGLSGQVVTCGDCHTVIHGIGNNQPPIASAGPDKAVPVGQAVTLSAQGSSDPDGTITGYAWDFGDGTKGTGVSVTHAYSTAGIYNVVLTVTDNLGSTASDTAVITVGTVTPPTVPAGQVLYITRLTNRTDADSRGTTTDITAKFSDNVLTDQYSLTRSTTYSEAAIKINRDANTSSAVYLRLYVNYLGSGSQTLRIYPYKSDGTSLNSTYYKDFTVSAQGWVEFDVTSLAAYMKTFGWMKFRVTCTTTRADVGEGNFRIQ